MPEDTSEGDTPQQTDALTPPNPIMGTYHESYPGAKDWFAISGGTPLADWTGLDPDRVSAKTNPRQHRPLAASQKRKAYEKRIIGLYEFV